MTFFVILAVTYAIIYGTFFEEKIADKKVKKYEKEQRERGLY